MEVKEILNKLATISYVFEVDSIFKSFGLQVIQVENLIKELDKYRQMWEELKNRNDDFFPNYGVRADNKIRMNCIEQKYFPKEIIDKVIEGIIEQIKEGAEISRKETKSDGS